MNLIHKFNFPFIVIVGIMPSGPQIWAWCHYNNSCFISKSKVIITRCRLFCMMIL